MSWAQGVSQNFPQNSSLVEGSDRANTFPLGDWMVDLSFLAGTVFNDNILQTSIPKISTEGIRFAPRLSGELDNGIYRTTVYGSMDGQFYSNASFENQINAQAGLAQIYEVQRDLVFRFQGDYSRETGLFNSSILSPIGSSPSGGTVSNPTASNIIASPIGTTIINPSNQFTASAFAEKSLARGFLVLGGSVAQTTYDNSGSLDGTIATLSSRTGYWVTPQLYIFAQASIDSNRYNTGSIDSNGYKMVGGIGSNQIGLLRGELVGGYQQENYMGVVGNAGTSVYGAHLYYYPTRYWTWALLLDRTLTTTSAQATLLPGFSPGTPSILPGTPVSETSALLQSDYAMSRVWSVSARLGYIQYQYTGTTRVDNGWLMDARLSCQIHNNMSLTLDYQRTELSSTVSLASYTQNVITAGVFYRY
jgi:hypothetical protein